VLQDFTGVPLLATWRRCACGGQDGPQPETSALVPVDLVVDHSSCRSLGGKDSLDLNMS